MSYMFSYNVMRVCVITLLWKCMSRMKSIACVHMCVHVFSFVLSKESVFIMTRSVAFMWLACVMCFVCARTYVCHIVDFTCLCMCWWVFVPNKLFNLKCVYTMKFAVYVFHVPVHVSLLSSVIV